MSFWGRLGICAAISIVGHYVIVTILDLLPPTLAASKAAPVEILVVTPPPPPPPEPPKPPPDEPKPPDPTPLPPPKVVPKIQPNQTKPPTPPAVVPNHDVAPAEGPAGEHSVAVAPTTDTPVYGVTMDSTSQGGKGPAVPVGNTTSPTAERGAPPKGAPPKGEPVAAYEVTKMPLPQGRCAGKYTDEAKAAGTEGVVVLDVTVDESGHTKDITVVDKLDHGLTEAAVAALRACTFTPGEKGGQKVAVRVRGFKIRFVMETN